MEYMRIEDQFPRLNNCAVTLGKFDGIHRGHRKLMDKILERKKETGVHAVVLAFVSDRKTVLTNSERRDFLEHMGADILLECPPVSYTHLDVYKRQGFHYEKDLYRSQRNEAGRGRSSGACLPSGRPSGVYDHLP